LYHFDQVHYPELIALPLNIQEVIGWIA